MTCHHSAAIGACDSDCDSDRALTRASDRHQAGMVAVPVLGVPRPEGQGGRAGGRNRREPGRRGRARARPSLTGPAETDGKSAAECSSRSRALMGSRHERWRPSLSSLAGQWPGRPKLETRPRQTRTVAVDRPSATRLLAQPGPPSASLADPGVQDPGPVYRSSSIAGWALSAPAEHIKTMKMNRSRD